MIRVVTPAQVNSKRVIDDLNGSRQPFGLELCIREVYGHAVAHYDFKPWTDEYVAELRRCLDLWLATGRQKNGVEIPAKRRPVNAVNEIVERVVGASKVLPVAYCNRYSMSLQLQKHLPRRDWQTEAAQKPLKSDLMPEDFASQLEYEKALCREILLAPRAGSSHEAPARETRDNVPVLAAERMFVEILFSDWSLKVAKCVDQRCGMYFRLGKWNHRYVKGTRCPGCRTSAECKDKKDRAERNRDWAHRELCALAAKRYATTIAKNDSWYRDSELKKRICASLNDQIKSDVRLRKLLPAGVTVKWLSRATNFTDIANLAASQMAERRASA